MENEHNNNKTAFRSVIGKFERTEYYRNLTSRHSTVCIFDEIDSHWFQTQWLEARLKPVLNALAEQCTNSREFLDVYMHPKICQWISIVNRRETAVHTGSTRPPLSRPNDIWNKIFIDIENTARENRTPKMAKNFDSVLISICMSYLNGDICPGFAILNDNILRKAFIFSDHDKNAAILVSIFAKLGMNWVSHLRDMVNDITYVLGLLDLTTYATEMRMRDRIINYLGQIDLKCSRKQFLYAKALRAIFASKYKHKNPLACITEAIPTSLPFFIHRAMKSGTIPLPGEQSKPFQNLRQSLYLHV